MNIGCKLGVQPSNIIAYADDIVLLAPSATALQMLLDSIYSKLLNLDMCVNGKKSKVMIFDSKKISLNISRNCR